jgi:wyosine [tRNA(Phe)-imidazoG37] synthetase (radical SAM superfamily)
MPSHDDVLEFANTLAPLVDRRLLDDSRPSRVALVGREKIPLPIPEKIMDFPEDLGIAPPIKHLTLAKATEN